MKKSFFGSYSIDVTGIHLEIGGHDEAVPTLPGSISGPRVECHYHLARM
jgi:hypothetical protein